MGVFWAVLLVLGWAFLGFIAMGVLSALWIEGYTFDHWQKVKHAYRLWATVLGPLLFVVVIAYMIYAIVITTTRDHMSIWELPDWILAGFNGPPTQPKESTLNSPTVSP